MNRQLRKGRPSLLAHREAGETDASAYEKTIAKLESGPVPEFSGRRLFERDPRKYVTIVRMLSENLATAAIARACGVSPSTVMAVRMREQIPVEIEREKLLNLVRSAARLSVEKLLELIPSMSARDASIATGILLEKQQLLQGEPTSISLNRDEQFQHASFNDLLNALPTANVVEINSQQALVEPQGAEKPGGAAA